MNCIKIIKKSEIIKRNAASSAEDKVPDARFNEIKMKNNVKNWVSERRERNETEKRHSLKYVTRSKLNAAV